MHTRHVDGVTIRALRNGDTATVSALFERLGPRSRERRFCGAKPRLSDHELRLLARVDAEHHVLVGYVDDDPEPVGIARVAREGTSAEIAFAVADEYQGRGIGTTLTHVLAADARAAGVTELVATVCGDNTPAVSLIARISESLQVRWQGGERELVARLP
jgi:ribosomal protein S18 acetylase RimI-like enzyme